MTAVLGLNTFAALAACSVTRDLDYLQKGDEAIVPPAPEDATTPPPQKDAGTPAEAAPDAGCATGTVVRPLSTFKFALPPPAGQPSQALACFEENAIADDGQLARLDRVATDDDPAGKALFEKTIYLAGCVGVQFDETRPIDVVWVKMGPIDDACGSRPCTPDDSAGCGSPTGRNAFILVGKDAKVEDLTVVAKPTLFDDFRPAHEDLTVARLAGDAPHDAIAGAHVVIVCRNGNSSEFRDDVGVDAIWAECK